MSEPRLVVFSSLFPHAGEPGAGLFVRERMFRVGRLLPITVVSPRPWFPGQGLIRRLRPGYRPPTARREVQDGVEVLFPRFFALPALCRHWDGFFMALGSLAALVRLRRSGHNLIDAHFAWPDGYAAALLGRWLNLPVTITLRGTEPREARHPDKRRRMERAFALAERVFAVSESLRRLAVGLGAGPGKSRVVGNGVDAERFRPEERAAARDRYAIPRDGRVLISVGALVERKGFHRVLDCLPELLRSYPGLHYLIVGGASPEGNIEAELRAQVRRLGLDGRVHFLGALPPDELRWPLSAADCFVLATANEGWANVFLEAMACGLPVVTTDVGGNTEVVSRAELGTIVPFGDPQALAAALHAALGRDWDRRAIRDYAEANAWDRRVEVLVEAFRGLVQSDRPGAQPREAAP